MKQHLTGKKLAVTAMLAISLLTSCSKEVTTKNIMKNPAETLTVAAQSALRDTASVRSFLTGPFLSQVNTTTKTDSSVMVFDFIFQKKFEKGEHGTVAIAFGDGQFADRGWKYNISVNDSTQQLIVTPNSIMAAAIARNSFQVVSATFDKNMQIFNFITRFKELNGNRSEVGETLSKR